jgi:hypothetical protein
MTKYVFGLLLASLTVVQAQVLVEIVQDQDRYLPGEALRMGVQIRNRSGRTLTLGESEDWLTFTVQRKDGSFVEASGDVPVMGEFDVEPSQIATKYVDLNPNYSLDTGHYSVSVSARIPGLEAQIDSEPKHFDVVTGNTLWEQEFGVPLAPGVTNAPLEVRKYVLNEVISSRGERRLYVVISDSSGRNIRATPVGRTMSISHPEAMVDSATRLHITYQNGAHTSAYLTYSPDAELLTRQSFEMSPSRPRLAHSETGDVLLVGGIRRLTTNDVPALQFLLPSDEDSDAAFTNTPPMAPAPGSRATPKPPASKG